MLTRSFLPSFTWIALTMFLGCGETPSSATAETGDPADGSIAVLTPEAIQSLAEKQKVCAVTGEPLGSMGDPVPVLVKGENQAERTVLLCCESCREELLGNTEKYLAQLDARSKPTP
ncbi:MAG: hypothetical protein WBC44_05790 [Planctomycetaceae bacterium]